MMLESAITERNLIAQFLLALRELPDVSAELSLREAADGNGNSGYDAQINVQVSGKSIVLLINARKSVYPRDVRQVLWKLKEAEHGRPTAKSHPHLPLFVAESISPGAKELLRHERVGYFDSGGSLYLPASGAYFYVDKPPPKTLAKSVRSLFSGRRAQVLQTLLAQHQNWFGVKALAEQAMVSPATASQVLTELERFEWLASRGQGPNKERHLREPTALLDAWVKQLESLRPTILRRYYVPAVQAGNLIERISTMFDAHDVGYAISHEAAAQRYAPFLSNVSQVRTRLLMGVSADAAIADLSARVVTEGANLVIIEATSPGELLFRQQVGGAWLASPIQVYLDLLRSEGRAKEMAEHLRKEKIGF